MILPIAAYNCNSPRKITSKQQFSANIDNKENRSNNNHKTAKIFGGSFIGLLLVWGLMDIIGDKGIDYFEQKSNKKFAKELEEQNAEMAKDMEKIILDLSEIPLDMEKTASNIARETAKKGLKTVK